MNFLKKVIRIIHYHLFGGIAHAKFMGVTLGTKCRIYINNWGSEPYLITIGNNVTITGGVKLLTHDGSTCLVESEKGRYFRYGRINIGNNVFIGANAIILPGVNICDDVVLGAGSVLARSIEKSGIYAGCPAKFLREFDSFKAKTQQTGTQNDGKEYKTDKERILSHLKQKN